MKDPFCYSFRFCCDPWFNEPREIVSLARFVREAQIDDVSVFCNVEELNTGHTTREEQDVYLSLLDAVREAVGPLGASLSVNPWHSLMHADLGKALRPGHDFRRMVDVEGREASLCVCPLDENWQRYFAALYARYAEKEPNILWVEDDFRFHNHDPLVWGGCFCQAHMAEYSRRAGKSLTREEFLRGVLAPGGVHPYRRIWLDTCRETMDRIAGRVGQAVHAVSPDTRVGLMSSVPYIHAAEGRDWHGLLRGFAAGNRPVSRIHLPCYVECSPQEYLQRFNMVSMANRALIPRETQVYPELENYPYSRFAKSRAFTRFQLLSALPLELAGMTIDLFDLNGGGIVFSEGYQDTLRTCKPFLNAVAKCGVMGLEKRGVRVLISETSSYTLHTREGRQMEELYPQEVFFAALLSAFGIPFRYDTDPGFSGCVAAVSGQYFRNLTEPQITRLFAENRLILSGDAVETLLDMGLGRLAGVESCRWMAQNGGEYTFEQVVNGKPYLGLDGARASAVISSADALNVRYAQGAVEYTRFCDSFRRFTAPGHTVVENRVLVYPFGRFENPGVIPPMQLTSLRRELMQDAVAAFGALDAPMVTGGAYLQPYCTADEEHIYCYLVNASLDAVPSVTLDMGRYRLVSASVLTSDCRSAELAAVPEGERTMLPLSIPPLDAALLTLRVEKE